MAASRGAAAGAAGWRAFLGGEAGFGARGPILATHPPIALGLGVSANRWGQNLAPAAFFGERAPEQGCCGGRGGSMHLLDRESGFWGAVPIVGSTLPIALGLALSDKRMGRNLTTAAFFGEGATEEGVFTETLNLACVLKLPMLFICENNGFSVYTPLEPRRSPHFDFGGYARSHGSHFFTGDGNDVEEVWRVTGQALEAMRRHPTKPAVLEFFTWRYY